MPNSLTRQAGLRLGPIVLETLIKHYFDRARHKSASMTNLRQDELLYDQVFNIVKSFLEAASHHTVEEVQNFANTRTPSPPWVHVVRLTVPMTCCDDAATYLIDALGGEDVAKRVVGGVKWWQVRGNVNGIDAQWVTARKDWREAKRRHKNRMQTPAMPQSPTNAHAEIPIPTTPLPASSSSSNIDSSDTPPRADTSDAAPSSNPEGVYDPREMDQMRCILYSHGGGYYFGSVDQERYSIQRHARKINGRVFAINYRLAPQYPFPCALQDLLAAYLYLIRPPPGAPHLPIPPSLIIIAGDSAGGGLSLALLQVIRDAGLPPPASGVLISPWCDMTHSFGSIHTNTATDVIPPWGLSMQKPSTLWPPPSDEMTNRVHASLRSRIRQTLHLDSQQAPALTANGVAGNPIDVGATTSLPPVTYGPANQTISIVVPVRSKANAKAGPGPASPPSSAAHTGEAPPLTPGEPSLLSLGATRSHGYHPETSGDPETETLTITQQIQLYTPNSLLVHPLVSSALSYLGGLPPLFFIASDGEVLRDEIIYTAHRAANPDEYTIKDSVREMYPSLVGIEGRHKATPVHLQVYDDTAHVLPVLFSFTTPGKFCYRAIATFCKHVAPGGMTVEPTVQSPIFGSFPFPNITSPAMPGYMRGHSTPSMKKTDDSRGRTPTTQKGTPRRSGSHPPITPTKSPSRHRSPSRSRDLDTSPSVAPSSSVEDGRVSPPLKTSVSKIFPSKSIRRSLSLSISRARSAMRGSNLSTAGDQDDPPPLPSRDPIPRQDSDSSDVAGPRFPHTSRMTPAPSSVVRSAGDPAIYNEIPLFPSWNHEMIRERVSTQGVIRPLEPEAELPALNVPHEIIGVLSELAVRRYIDAKTKFDKKFDGVIKNIEKERRHNLERAKKDAIRQTGALQSSLLEDNGEDNGKGPQLKKGIKEGIMAVSGSWSWAWVLDEDERPPPSSIVSRRDTHEARRLAHIADQSIPQEDSQMSGNNLWSLVVNFLTVTPDKEASKDGDTVETGKVGHVSQRPTPERKKSMFARFASKGRSSGDYIEGPPSTSPLATD